MLDFKVLPTDYTRHL